MYSFSYCKTLLDHILKEKKSNKISEEIRENLLLFHEKMQDSEQLENYNVSIMDKVRIVRMHRKLMEIVPQYQKIDGSQNIWVVKPSYNARGIGIYLTKKLKDIITLGKKSQSKVV